MVLERKLSPTMEKSFRFRASFSPCLILEILHNNLLVMERELTEMVNRTPKLFVGSPVAIDLEKMTVSEKLDFDQLKKIFLLLGMIPVGIRGGDQAQQDAAALAGLPLVNIGKTPPANNKSKTTTQTEAAKSKATKLVTHPIRSGIQVSSKEGDLIVIAQVSPGAELVAAGHIHVYGVLRGRALAGAYGNRDARIFCRHLEAELVSIAGYYLTKEEMSPISASDNMIQIYLENEKIQIKEI